MSSSQAWRGDRDVLSAPGQEAREPQEMRTLVLKPTAQWDDMAAPNNHRVSKLGGGGALEQAPGGHT